MGRHDAERKRHDESRYWMRAGMAKAALQIKRERELKDTHDQPLSYAKRMAEGHSERQLEQWAKHRRKVYIAP